MKRTNSQYNLHLYDSYRSSFKYGIPLLDRVEVELPKSLIGFNEAMSTSQTDCGVHFFLDDYQFERVWNQPERYLDTLQRFNCVLSPDFSLYMDMPEVMQMWNVYRSRLIGQFWQDNGIKVIPTISWSDDKSFDYCFMGIPLGSTVAISTVGVMKSEESKAVFREGVKEMKNRLFPETVIVYGKPFPEALDGLNCVGYKNQVIERLSAINQKPKSERLC